jgi:hypothetical protein
MPKLDRAIDQMLTAIQPAETLRQQAATARVIDLAGGINPAALASHLAPLVLRWGPSDTGPWPVARSGRAYRLWACATTAPDLGPATITFSVLTEYSGEEPIGTLTIPINQQFASTAIVYDVPGNSAVLATVTTANGAGGVGSAIFIDTGGTT